MPYGDPRSVLKRSACFDLLGGVPEHFVVSINSSVQAFVVVSPCQKRVSSSLIFAARVSIRISNVPWGTVPIGLGMNRSEG